MMKIARETHMVTAWLAVLAVLLIFSFASSYGVSAHSNAQSIEEGGQLFQQYCQACHTIGSGALVGPDLADVTTRRERTWLAEFIARPDQKIASGDPVANELLAEFNNVPMPNLGLSEVQIESILVYLENPNQAGGISAVTVDLSGGDPQRGFALFSGKRPLANGGIACIACHNVAGAAPLGGGALGPDLTHAYSKFGDPGFASALVSLPFPTMRGVFSGRPLTKEEQTDLYAFLLQADQTPIGSQANASEWQWLAGGLGTLLLFGIMAIFWPRQRKSISAKLRELA